MRGWVAGVFALVLLGCSGTPNGEIDQRPPATDAGQDAAPVLDGAPSPDAAEPDSALPDAAAPLDAPADDAIHVAPDGNDATADGSRAHPYGSVSAAVKVAKALPVLVCAGTYLAPVALDASANGVTVSGGYDCATWTYSIASITTIAPTSGYALDIRDAAGIAVEDLRFVASDARTPGDSSVAAYVTRSSGITLRRITAVGGKGANGAAGVTPTTALPPAIVGNNAAGAPFTTGGQPVTLTCPYGAQSVGGAGGTGAQGGSIGLPIIADNNGQTGNACTPGTRGQDGAPVSDGPGAKTLGAWLTDGWRPSAGLAGDGGHTGQGGGGGGGVAGAGNGGGGGGTGGCGGAGGGAGQGGGASFGLVVYYSTVRLEGGSLVSGQAGAGGAGVTGQDGELGAQPGSATGGCHGGEGGTGARGASGGGGAGGVSAALVFGGTSPTSDGKATFTAGKAGERGVGPKGNDGIVGDVKTTLVLQ